MNEVEIFDNPVLAAEAAADYYKKTADNVFKKRDNLFVAVSGGKTPEILFEKLAGNSFRKNINWERVHFFWADERMVPPNDPESNYGTARKILFGHDIIPEKNIHRIKGENNPHEEVFRYAEEIDSIVEKGENGIPSFDLIFLGMGEDGHTASLFPGKELLLTDKNNICGLAENPVGQKRISLTRETINNAEKIIFLVTGRSKAGILSKIIQNSPEDSSLPAAQIFSLKAPVKWIIDKEASEFL